MKKTDIHFFSADAIPLVLQKLQDRGFKCESHRAIPRNDARYVESTCPDHCVILKVNYDV